MSDVILTAEETLPPSKWSNAWFDSPEGTAWMRDMYLHELVGTLRDPGTAEAEINQLPLGSDLGALGRDVIGLRDEMLSWAVAARLNHDNGV